MRSLRLCRRSQRRGRGIRPTLSKPQIYDADEASERQRARLSPGEERETASRRVFVLVSAVNTAWRVTPALYLFLDWVKRIHSREAYTEATKRNSDRVSQTHSFYDFIHFVMRTRAFVTRYSCLLRQYRVVLPQECSIGYTFVLRIHIYMYTMSHCVTRYVLQRFFVCKHSI